jgi:hypothetical protein
LHSHRTEWVNVGELYGENFGDEFGRSVALSRNGTTMAVGAWFHSSSRGQVQVFRYVNDAWTQTGADIDGEASGDRFGCAVGLSDDGTIVAIGAYLNDGGGNSAGHVRVHRYNSTGNWEQLGTDIDGEATNDESGIQLSLSSDGYTIAIGARLNDGGGANSGQVRVYQYASGSWSKIGSDIDGEASTDKGGNGCALSYDGTLVAIGEYQNDGNGDNAGQVRVFEYTTDWVQLGGDLQGQFDDKFGRAVALSGDGMIVAIGAKDGNYVSVFQYSGAWAPLGSIITGTTAGDSFGVSVTLSSDGMILGVGAKDAGAGLVRVFEYSNSTSEWEQMGPDLNGEDDGDEFGRDIEVSRDGTFLAVGGMEHEIARGHLKTFRFGTLDTKPAVL